MQSKLTKSQVIKLVSEKAPEYLEVFKDFQACDGGWLKWPKQFIQAKHNLKLDYYVTFYRDQKQIDVCLLLFMMGDEGFKEFNESFRNLSDQETQLEFEGITKELIEDDNEWVDQLLPEWPKTPEEEAELKAQFDLLSPESQKESLLRASYLYIHILCSIHNYFALMVCGEKMTSLVPKAIAGDDDAFCKAVKIDRNLLIAHPYFTERYQTAQANAELDFIKRLSHLQSSPALIGKIAYPGLYLVFSMLESLGWLDELTHKEILDICDAAGLDRWQNRIEDVNYVTKRLAGYRKYQLTGGLSMH